MTPPSGADDDDDDDDGDDKIACGTSDGKYNFSPLTGKSFKTLEKGGGSDAPTHYLSVCGASAQNCDVSCPYCNSD